jgi:dihydroneopterin triphosphate diphosphatase
VPEIAVRVVDVYPYRLVAGAAEFLLLRRAPGRIYAGQWRMVGGKIGPGEPAWKAAVREIQEEAGLKPVLFWALPSVNAFYEWDADRVNMAPAFAAQLDSDPVPDDEHDAFRWLAPAEAASLLMWPEQRRLLMLAAELIATGIPPELVVEL